MKIHEYQARQIFRDFGIPVPDSVLCYTVSEAEKAARDMNRMVVVKAQVLAGGRGKAGGVKLARSVEDAVIAAKQILGMDIKGYTVEKVLVADAVDISKEFYVGLINDRNTKTVTLMASAEGGVEIEEVAKDSPEKIIKFPINPLTGLLDYQARNVALELFGDIKLAQKAASIFTKLYKLYIETDATLAEINPLVLTPDNDILAIDGKMNFDDNALFRQPKILAMREPDEAEQQEIAANEKGLSYIKLDGNIGCMVN
ncbi:MAG: acetate--CoA ligase family protein, partial [Prolixibacteraceae bacterium]|nr:acetate--CoA ligase family protein [Prolixibacteraceae bacterium]